MNLFMKASSAVNLQGELKKNFPLTGKPAIKPSIEGWAKIYGYNIISIDKDDDPYAYGFQV